MFALETSVEIINYGDIGERICRKRKELALTQEQLGAATSLAVSTVNRIENGKSKAGLASLVQIANALNLSMDELLCGSLDSSVPVYQKEFGALLEGCNAQEIRLLMKISMDVLQSFRSACKQNEN